MNPFIKEHLWCNIKITAYFIKLAHGRQRTSGADILDVTFIFTKIKTHLIFGYIFSKAQLCDSVCNIFFIHFFSPRFLYFNLFTKVKLRIKIGVLKVKRIILLIISVICGYNTTYMIIYTESGGLQTFI